MLSLGLILLLPALLAVTLARPAPARAKVVVS